MLKNLAFIFQRYCSSKDSEVNKAKKAAQQSQNEPTIFSKIIDKTIPATIIHEDDKVSQGTMYI